MPRKLRVEYPGAMYHVMSRGDRCENIFLDEVDRQDSLQRMLSIKGIAARVHLGASKSANARLHQFMTPLPPSDPPQGQLRI